MKPFSITAVMGFARSKWVVDIDLEKFFDKVNHERLMSTIKADIKDPRILRVIHCLLKAAIVLPEGVVVKNEGGVPQGGPLSPLLVKLQTTLSGIGQKPWS